MGERDGIEGSREQCTSRVTGGRIGYSRGYMEGSNYIPQPLVDLFIHFQKSCTIISETISIERLTKEAKLSSYERVKAENHVMSLESD